MFHGMKGYEASLHTAHVSQANLIKGGDIMEHVQEQGFQRSKVSVREMVKNQKGLTLIELLAVIVILAIIAAIAIPSISAIIQNSERKAHISNAQQLVDAARLMVAAKGFGATGEAQASTKTPVVAPAVGYGTKVTIKKLIEEGYLARGIEDPYVKGTNYHDENSYVLIDRVSETKDGVTTDLYYYYVKLQKATLGASEKPYYDETPESSITDVGHGTVNIK